MSLNRHSFRLLFFVFMLLPFVAVHGGENQLSSALQPFVDSGQAAGFVTLVAQGDRIIDCSVVGYLDVDSKKPMKRDSLFWIASMSKPITATAVMMLVDEGKISLDDPISKYFPQFNDLKVVSKSSADGTVVLTKPKSIPTVRQVLSHTGGFPFLTQYMKLHGIDSLPPQRLVTVAAMTPLSAAPGTKSIYSNVGIDIASAIVEKVSGLPFETFLNERLFQPLGMKDTTFYPTQEQMSRLATSYSWDKAAKKLKSRTVHYLTFPYSERHIRFPEGGGGLFSTADDVLKFHRMLAANGLFEGKRILSEAAVAEMSKDQTKGLASYGLGLNIGDNGKSFGHGGAYGTNGRIGKDNGCITVFMVQSAGLPCLSKVRAIFATFAATAK